MNFTNMEAEDSSELDTTKEKGIDIGISPDGKYRCYGSPYKPKEGKITKLKRDDHRSKESSGSEDGRSNMPGNPEAGSRVKSAGQRTFNRKLNTDKQDTTNDTKRPKNFRIASGKKLKRTPKATDITVTDDKSTQEQVTVKIETTNPESKLQMYLAENLQDCSRQRLRAVHMSLRHYSNVDAKVTQKDLLQAFQDNYVKISGRIQQFLIDKFEDHQGIDVEKLYRYLTEAHSKSGRDSVLATQCRNNEHLRIELSQEERDNDLLSRLEDLLICDKAYFDLTTLRETLQSRDRNKAGKVEKFEILDIFNRLQVPLYGSLLKSLIKRCDDEKNDQISWPEFLSFLEKSQHNAWNKCPELAELPEKMKAKVPVVPDPIDELSEQTKSKLVNKLLKKASLKKVNKPQDTNKVNMNNNNISKDEVIKTTTTEEEIKITETSEKQNKDDKTGKSEQHNVAHSMQKVSNLVKTSSGFLSSMKNLISGKKSKSDLDENGVSSGSDSKQTNTGTALPTESEAPVFYIDTTSSNPNEKTVQKEENTQQTTKIDNVNKQQEIKKTEHKTTNSDPNTLEFAVHGRYVTLMKPPDFPEGEVKLDPPEERLKLDWVYGYRGNDCRSNIHVLPNDEIVYFISKIVVIYNRTEHKQRHYREHTEDIKCIAVHSDGFMIASGQFVDRHKPLNMAHIRIWRVDNLQTVHVLGSGMFEKAVMCLAFAKEGDILVATDNSREKKLMVWDIQTCQLIGQTVLDTEVICDLSFNAKYPEILVTTGKEHLNWWKIYPESKTIQLAAQPDYENYLKAKFIICLIHNDKGDLITGDSNGTVYIWGDGGNKITNFIKHGHDGPVFTLLCYKSYLFSGGRDGMLNCWTWNKNMDLSVSLAIPKSEGGVRMIQVHHDSVLIGTTMNSLLSAKLTSKQSSSSYEMELDSIPITQGHFDDLRGLITVTQSDISADFITAGLDGIICWFNTGRRDPVCKLVLKGMQFVCVDWYPVTKHLALGTKDGHLVILEIAGESSTEVLNQKICKDRLNTVKFSPDGLRIAAGSHDACVYIYDLKTAEDGTSSWQLHGKVKEHNGPIYCIDWSLNKIGDDYVVRSCSSNQEQVFWRASTLEKVSEYVSFNTKWNSYNCRLDVSLYGVWLSKQSQGGDILCVDVDTERNLVAMGDSNGYLSLFRYPCPKKGVFCHTYRCHYSVQNVHFTGDHVITVGGRDSSIMQWKLV